MSTKDFYSDEHNIQLLNNDLNISTGNENSLVVTSTLNASSNTSGSIKTAGGMGIAKDLYIGGNLYYSGSIIADGVGAFDLSSDVSPWLVIFNNTRSTTDCNVLKLDFENLTTPSAVTSENNWIGFYFGSTEHGRIKPQTTSGSDLGVEISAPDIIDIESGTINLNSEDINLNIDSGVVTIDHPSTTTDEAIKVNSYNENAVVVIDNNWPGSTGDILDLRFTNLNFPEHTNNWIRFYAQDDLDPASNVIVGGVRGTESGEDAFVIWDGSSIIRSTQVTNRIGSAQFYSKGADFGEWFELGDETEWPESYTIPEGMVVYVKDRKIYRKADGVPFVVTNRALVVGNYIDASKKGAILSFAGQVPVVIEGKCAVGDLVIPDDNSTYAINPNMILFSEYKRALGTCLESKEDETATHVWVAIGKK
ncbi:hypothetical protein N9W84_00675 [bacterium]|nr:hypothetical protein [bacterium]